VSLLLLVACGITEQQYVLNIREYRLDNQKMDNPEKLAT
jgi:major membrane immunogen (membrane-anchored lipoprotein)